MTSRLRRNRLLHNTTLSQPRVPFQCRRTRFRQPRSVLIERSSAFAAKPAPPTGRRGGPSRAAGQRWHQPRKCRLFCMPRRSGLRYMDRPRCLVLGRDGTARRAPNHVSQTLGQALRRPAAKAFRVRCRGYTRLRERDRVQPADTKLRKVSNSRWGRRQPRLLLSPL